LYNRIV
jgi:hypothetical protein